MRAKPLNGRILKGAKTYFGAFVQGLPAGKERPLPMTHTTDAYTLRDILNDGEITPNPCSVFNEDLSYFYYGRPAYRKNGSIQANNIAAYAPIVFILDPRICDEAPIAFPFDSGAFKDDRYGDLTHHRMRVEDFGLDPTCEQIGKLVGFFYGGNRSYYDQICTVTPDIPQMEHEAHAYHRLINTGSKNDRDDRSTTIEMLLDKSTLLSGSLIAIIVPSSLLSDTIFKKRLNQLKCEILPYVDGAKLTPASHVPLLVDIVRRFYFKRKILK